MTMNLETIIWVLLLIDALGANLTAWFSGQWYQKYFPSLSKYFPASKGWTAYYLVLVLWIGWLLSRLY